MSELRRLQSALAQGQQKTSELRERLGESTNQDTDQVITIGQTTPGQGISIRGCVVWSDKTGVTGVTDAHVRVLDGGPSVPTGARGEFSVILPPTFKAGQRIRLEVSTSVPGIGKTLDLTLPESGDLAVRVVLYSFRV